MGRAKGDPQQRPNVPVPRGRARLEASELPEQVARILPKGTAQAWLVLRKLLPEDLYLIGGTAIAVHLGHRKSQDLDFIFHEEKVDLVALSKALRKLSDFAVERESPGALRGFLGKAKVEFFHADEDPERTQRILEPPEEVAGLRVASLKDLAAMKLKVLRDRPEMRDYFDLKQLEEEGEVTVEDALVFFMERYGVSAEHEAVPQIIRCLGFMDDVQEDEALPISKKELAAWWQRRQKVLIRGLGITPP